MDRRAFVAGLGGMLVAPFTLAQVRRIGYLSLQSRSSEWPRVEAFRRGLSDLGYAEGVRLSVAYRHAEGAEAKLEPLAGELAKLQVALVVAVGVPAVRAAARVMPQTPIVFPLAGDPVRTGLVESLARPGGRITGLSSLTGELGSKRLSMLKEAAPAARVVAVFWNPGNRVHQPSLADLDRAAAPLGVRLVLLEVRKPAEFEAALARAVKAGAEALFLLPDEMFHARRKEVAAFAAARRLPAMYFASEWVLDGGLMSYGAHIPDLFRRAAEYVVRILEGANPADMPIEQPTRFEFFVNLKAARAIGLGLPQSLLLRADRVIE